MDIVFLDYPDNRIRANAIKALWSMRDRSGLLALQKMITSQTTEDRLSAVWLLGQVEIPRRTDILRKIAAKDPSQRVRDKAAEVTAKLEAQVNVPLPLTLIVNVDAYYDRQLKDCLSPTNRHRLEFLQGLRI